jgi:hypothetical protein
MPAQGQTLKQTVRRGHVNPAIYRYTVCERPLFLVRLTEPGWRAKQIEITAPAVTVSEPGRDAFGALSRDCYVSSQNFKLSDDDDFNAPLRVDDARGEFFSDPHAKLLVIKKRR